MAIDDQLEIIIHFFNKLQCIRSDLQKNLGQIIIKFELMEVTIYLRLINLFRHMETADQGLVDIQNQKREISLWNFIYVKQIWVVEQSLHVYELCEVYIV